MFGRLTRKALVLGAGRGTVVFGQFLINLLLVRWWTPEEFGQFHQIRVVLSLATLLDLGLPVGILQAAGGRDDSERRRLFQSGVSLAAVAGVLTGLGFVVAAFVVNDDAVASALPSAGLFIAATILAATLESVLIVRERHLRASVIDGVTALLGVAGTYWTLTVYPTIEAVYLCFALAVIIRTALLWWWSGLTWRIILPWKTRAGSLLRTSLVVSANRTLGMASSSVDRAVVAFSFSAATLGWYVTGAWEVPFLSILSGAITATILPEMSMHWAAGRREDMLGVWRSAVSRMAWVVLPIWLWAWVWAPELLRVLFTANYEEGLPVFRVYLLVLPLRVAVYSVIFLAMDETRLLLWGAALDLLFNLLLSLALAPLIGPLGPAIATTTVTWMQTIFYLVAAARLLRVPTARLLPWKHLRRAATSAALAVVPTLAVRSWIEGDLPRVVVTSAFTAVIVAGVFLGMERHRFMKRPAPAQDDGSLSPDR